jgi:hypothetical protein
MMVRHGINSIDIADVVLASTFWFLDDLHMSRSTDAFVPARRRFRCAIIIESPGTGLGTGLAEWCARRWPKMQDGPIGHITFMLTSERST